jgi:hypothetical protein
VAADGGRAPGRRSEDEDAEPGRGGGGGAKPLLPVAGAGGGAVPETTLPFAARLAGAVPVAVDNVAAEAPDACAGGGSAKVIGGYGFAPIGLEEDEGALPFTANDVVVVPAAAPCPSAGAI